MLYAVDKDDGIMMKESEEFAIHDFLFADPMLSCEVDVHHGDASITSTKSFEIKKAAVIPPIAANEIGSIRQLEDSLISESTQSTLNFHPPYEDAPQRSIRRFRFRNLLLADQTRIPDLAFSKPRQEKVLAPILQKVQSSYKQRLWGSRLITRPFNK